MWESAQLVDGTYTLEVRAVDAGGAGPVATANFTVAADLDIDWISKPEGTTSSRYVTATFTAPSMLMGRKTIISSPGVPPTLKVMSEERTALRIVTSREAVALVENGDYSLVVLDWMMPEMSGIDTLKRIRLTRSGTDLPVIIATARSARSDVIEALGAGANDYITKPIDFPVAIARIETLVTNHLGVRMLRQANEAMRNVNLQLEKETSEREKAEDKAAHLAKHDALTGLGNRTKLLKTLNAATRRSDSHLEIHCVDLEGFRAINGMYGYAVGDAVLKAVAARLQDALTGDGCVARLGGDEFAILRILDAPARNDPDFADMLRAALSQPVKVGDKALPVSARVSHVCCKGMPKSADEIMAEADLALSTGKPMAVNSAA